MALPRLLEVPASAPPDREHTVDIWPDPDYPPDASPPMPETPVHYNVCVYLYRRLYEHFQIQGRMPTLIVNADMYTAPGAAPIAPDLLLAFGVKMHGDASYRMWVAGKPPDLVVEVASKSTWKRDGAVKAARYWDMGVPEYWQYDASGGEWLDEPLIGWQWAPGGYERIALESFDGVDCYVSRVLQMRLGILTPAQVQTLEPNLAYPLSTVRVRLQASDGSWYPVEMADFRVREQLETAQHENADLRHENADLRHENVDLHSHATDLQHENADLRKQMAEMALELQKMREQGHDDLKQ